MSAPGSHLISRLAVAAGGKKTIVLTGRWIIFVTFAGADRCVSTTRRLSKSRAVKWRSSTRLYQCGSMIVSTLFHLAQPLALMPAAFNAVAVANYLLAGIQRLVIITLVAKARILAIITTIIAIARSGATAFRIQTISFLFYHLIPLFFLAADNADATAAGLWRDDKVIVNTRDSRRGPCDALGLFPLHQRAYMARQRDFSIGGFDHDPVFAEQRAGRERGDDLPLLISFRFLASVLAIGSLQQQVCQRGARICLMNSPDPAQSFLAHCAKYRDAPPQLDTERNLDPRNSRVFPHCGIGFAGYPL